MREFAFGLILEIQDIVPQTQQRVAVVFMIIQMLAQKITTSLGRQGRGQRSVEL